MNTERITKVCSSPSCLRARWGTTVRLRDLDEQAMYTLRTKEGEITKSGSYLMYHGLDLHLNGDYASTIIRFECKQ